MAGARTVNFPEQLAVSFRQRRMGAHHRAGRHSRSVLPTLFDVSQPDWNWENSDVLEEFDRVLRFWFDRGIDGFRIDVANSLVKESGLPDLPENEKFGELVGDSPMWDQPELASIQRRWRAIADEYADTPEGPRMFVAEAYLPHDRLVRYLESDRLHTSFNFEFLISA